MPLRTAGEQRDACWAKAIRSYAAVPEVYKDFFAPFQAEEHEFPYTVFTPSYEGFIYRTTEKLCCDFVSEIYVLERIGNTFCVQCYPRAEISRVEVKTILLDSSIKISGLTKDGFSASSAFRFNSVTDFLFRPILQRIRLCTVEIDCLAENPELTKFDPWRRVNHKFTSYARRSLLAGEKVVYAILQPEIRETVLKVLGKTYHRMISPTLASILTDRELIMIQEERKRVGGSKYGGIWDFMPLKRIKSLSLVDVDHDLLALSVEFFEGTHLEYLFQANQKRQICQLLECFEKLAIA